MHQGFGENGNINKIQPTQKMFVAVAGNIGSGKTTLTKKLSQRLNWKPQYEPVDNNPYLQTFIRICRGGPLSYRFIF